MTAFTLALLWLALCCWLVLAVLGWRLWRSSVRVHEAAGKVLHAHGETLSAHADGLALVYDRIGRLENAAGELQRDVAQLARRGPSEFAYGELLRRLTALERETDSLGRSVRACRDTIV